jgi:hypothetical protein
VSLTLKMEQSLTAAGLVDFFDQDPEPWKQLAAETKTFVKEHFPDGATIRRDDVAMALVPLLEVHENLAACMQEKKLTQKYWIRYFADLIVDRSWATINA